MLQRLATLTILFSAIAWCAVVVLERIPAAGRHLRSAHGELDAGWRRTSVGWERLAPPVLAWRGSDSRAASSAAGPEVPLPRTEPAIRWDFHPAILALLLLLAVTTAFGLFPGGGAVASNRQSQSLF
jgi:hypothetical protein